MWNEGGLFGERVGWHLPGFDTSGPQWEDRELSQGLPGGKAGVGFFIKTFTLDPPRETDALMSFQFGEELGQAYRALLFVNGWKYGKVGNYQAYRSEKLTTVSWDFAIARRKRGTTVKVPRSSWDTRIQRNEVSGKIAGASDASTHNIEAPSR